MLSKTRMFILAGLLLLAAVADLGWTWWNQVPTNAVVSQPKPRPHPQTPMPAQQPAPAAFPEPSPSTGVPPTEAWLPHVLSVDEKAKRAASDDALMREERLNDEAAMNIRRLQAELMQKQYDLADTQLDGALAKSITDPSYEFVELGMTNFTQGADYLGVSPLPELFIDEWAKARPQSPWSHYGMGMHLLQEVWAIRGEHYADTVSDAHWQMMHRLSSKARIEFDKALKLNPNILMALSGLINIDQVDGTQADAKRDYLVAVARRPASLRLPGQYEETLQPRWGGNYASMDVLAHEEASKLEANPRFWSLLGNSYADKGYTAVEESCSPCSREHWAASLKYYNAALMYEDKPDWLDRAGQAAIRLHHYGLAYRYYERVHAYVPAMFSWYAQMRLLQALCAPDYDADKFEVMKQTTANYTQLPVMDYPRVAGDCKYYQVELAWGDEPIPDVGNVLPYQINMPMPVQQAPKK